MECVRVGYVSIKFLLMSKRTIINSGYFFLKNYSASGLLSNGMIIRPKPIAVQKTEVSPTKICGHSAAISRTDQTNKNPPNIISVNPNNLIFQLVIVITSSCKSSFFTINKN